MLGEGLGKHVPSPRPSHGAGVHQPGWRERSSWDSPANAPLLSPGRAGPRPPQGPPGDPHTAGLIHPCPLLPAPSHPQPHPPAAPGDWLCPGEVLGQGGLRGLTRAHPPRLQHPRARPAAAVPGLAELHGEVFTFCHPRSVGRQTRLFLSQLSAPAGEREMLCQAGERGERRAVRRVPWRGDGERDGDPWVRAGSSPQTAAGASLSPVGAGSGPAVAVLGADTSANASGRGWTRWQSQAESILCGHLADAENQENHQGSVRGSHRRLRARRSPAGSVHHRSTQQLRAGRSRPATSRAGEQGGRVAFCQHRGGGRTQGSCRSCPCGTKGRGCRGFKG